jgi:hypothetical protein
MLDMAAVIEIHVKEVLRCRIEAQNDTIKPINTIFADSQRVTASISGKSQFYLCVRSFPFIICVTRPITVENRYFKLLNG